MTSNVVDSIVRRSNRNTLILSLAGILALAAVGFFSWRYLYNFFAGPVDITNQELAELSDPDSRFRYYVNVTGDDTAERVGRLVSTEERSGKQTLKAYYMVLAVGERLLLVEAPNDDSTKQYTGALVP